MEKIRVGLFGFGRTGKLVAEELIHEPNIELVWVIKKSPNPEPAFAGQVLHLYVDEGPIYSIDDLSETFFKEKPVDVIVDFSTSAAIQEYKDFIGGSTAVVSAISHYEPEDLALLTSCKDKAAILYSPNITIGINLLMIISQVLEKVTPHADIEIIEEHFKEKESVSGTAKKIADMLRLPPSLIHSIRVGKTIGKHMVIFGLPNQTIRISHESTNRAAFGQGAIFAINRIVHQQPGLYSMEQFLLKMFHEHIPVY